MAASIRIGTCSWADEALTKHWYPPGTPARERLPYYAERFSTVEVDSTYYRVPDGKMVQGWADRTPDGFTMHVKAFGLMTRHPVKLEQVPPELREGLPVDDRGRVDRPPRDARAGVFRVFLDALEPLRASGKLGGILFQMPPYVVWKPSSLDYLEWARDQVGDDVFLFEPRHRSWYADDIRSELLRWLEERRMSWVVVDAPKSAAANVPDTLVGVKSAKLTVVALVDGDTGSVPTGQPASIDDLYYHDLGASACTASPVFQGLPCIDATLGAELFVGTVTVKAYTK